MKKFFEIKFYTEVAITGVLYKKAVLKNFAILRGKHLCRSLF